MRTLVTAALAVTAGTLALAAPAAAELVYSSARCAPECRSEIWRVGDDGSGARRLLDRGASPAFDLLGTRVAYVDGGRLSVMEPDGSGARTVTPEGIAASDPAWSPAGDRILFTASDGPCQRPMLVDAAGGDPLPVPGTACGDRLARFSPDGARIMHLGHGDVPGGPAAIVSRPVAGGPAHEVVSRGAEVGPFTLAFSPDGRMLALALRGVIHTLDLVTGELVARSPQDGDVAWSPIGPALFFVRSNAEGSGARSTGSTSRRPARPPSRSPTGRTRTCGRAGARSASRCRSCRSPDVIPPLVALLPGDVSPPVARTASSRPRAIAAAARTIPARRLEHLFATDPSGVRAVDVALARQSGSRCRAVRGGRVERRRSRCAPRLYRRVAVDRIAGAAKRLPRGTYRLWIRATDGAGNRPRRPQLLRVRAN
jgi:hypothetical protein